MSNLSIHHRTVINIHHHKKIAVPVVAPARALPLSVDTFCKEDVREVPNVAFRTMLLHRLPLLPLPLLPQTKQEAAVPCVVIVVDHTLLPLHCHHHRRRATIANETVEMNARKTSKVKKSTKPAA
jgi:hypothetical protein